MGTQCFGDDPAVGEILCAGHSSRTNKPFHVSEVSIFREQIGHNHYAVGSTHFFTVLGIDGDGEHLHAGTTHHVDRSQCFGFLESRC